MTENYHVDYWDDAAYDPHTFYGFLHIEENPHIAQAPGLLVLTAIERGSLRGHMFANDGNILAVLGAKAFLLDVDTTFAVSLALDEALNGENAATAHTHIGFYLDRAFAAGLMPQPTQEVEDLYQGRFKPVE